MTYIKVTGSHGLKSAAPGDYSSCIADTTHHMFIFSEYERKEGAHRSEWTGRSWRCVLTTDELHDALKDRLELERRVMV